MSYHYVTVSAMFCKTAYTLSPRSLRMMPGALKMSILIFVPMKTEHNNTSVSRWHIQWQGYACTIYTCSKHILGAAHSTRSKLTSLLFLFFSKLNSTVNGVFFTICCFTWAIAKQPCGIGIMVNNLYLQKCVTLQKALLRHFLIVPTNYCPGNQTPAPD